MAHVLHSYVVLPSIVMFVASFYPHQDKAVEKKEGELAQSELGDKELERRLLDFKERVKSCERFEFTKIGDSGSVALRMRGKHLRFELEDIADCIGPIKVTKSLRLPENLDKPYTVPAWNITIMHDATITDKQDRKKLDASVVSVTLDDKSITMFFTDGSKAILDVEREVPFGRDDKLWSLFGKLLLRTLH